MAVSPTELIQSATLSFRRQDHAAAERELRLVLGEEPDNIRALVLLGIVFSRTGQVEEAQRNLEAALALEPMDFDALVSLAMLRKTRNDLVSAIRFLERAVRVRPNDPNLFQELGSCWLALRNGAKAATAFKQEIALQPQSVQGHFNLGLALKMMMPSGCSHDAYKTFLKVVDLAPDTIPAYVEIFNQMQRLMNWHEGLAVLEEGLQWNPDSPVIQVALAAAHGKLGHPSEADQLFRSAWASEPSAGPAYARWLQEEGQFETSAKILKDSIRLGAQAGVAYYNLTEARCFDIDGVSLVDLALDRLGLETNQPQDRMFLHYALARSYENRGDFETAMRHFDQANELAYQVYKCGESFNLQAMDAESRAIQRTFANEVVNELIEHGSLSTQPVFIVGMIRSGTTLLDQILSSHPMVRSAGELPFWVARAGPLVAQWHRRGMDPTAVRRLADEYLIVLNQATGDAQRITDKMPVNFRHLGLIRSAFPNARIIHLRRNPLDTAVSIYTTHLGRHTNFAYHKENVVGAYVSYLETVDYWRTILPSNRFLEIDYERLVSDTESVVRQLVAFCGLPWDEACLSHEQKRAHVSTPSLWTARQPVNTRSVDRWRRFEPWLGRLKDLSEATHPSTFRTGPN